MSLCFIIKSKKANKLYIGYTDNLKVRLEKHNKCLVKSTKRYSPWELVYYEAYKSRYDALRREKALKYFGKAYGQLKNRIKGSLDLDIKGAG